MGSEPVSAGSIPAERAKGAVPEKRPVVLSRWAMRDKRRRAAIREGRLFGEFMRRGAGALRGQSQPEEPPSD